jgi:hypothetical protein
MQLSLGLRVLIIIYAFIYGLIPYTYSFCANGRNNGWETRKILSFYIHGLSTMVPEINCINVNSFLNIRMASSGMLRHVALVRAKQCNILEDAILHSHHRENLKSCIAFLII